MEFVEVEYKETEEILSETIDLGEEFCETTETEETNVKQSLYGDRSGQDISTALGYNYPKITDVQSSHPAHPGSKRWRRKHRIPFRVNFCEYPDEYVMECEFPGHIKEELSILYADNHLIIVSASAMPKLAETETPHLVERDLDAVSRSFLLPRNASINNVSTRFVNGLLSIIFAKEDVSQFGRMIEIQ